MVEEKKIEIEEEEKEVDMKVEKKQEEKVEKEDKELKEENEEKKKKSSCIYDLFGVVNHSGSVNFGHYTANCKNWKDGKWYNFNDSFVSEVSEKDIVSRSAYLLFYERKNADVYHVY